jgi:uncharacterized membrane protein YdjX (TVP38/TMEM64 family)
LSPKGADPFPEKADFMENAQVSVGPEKLDDPIGMANVSRETGQGRLRLVTLALLVMSMIAVYYRFGDILTFDYLAYQESALRQFRTERPWLAVVAATFIYMAVAGLSIPGATVLTLVYGWYFGFWQGVIIVSIGSTGGATIAFLLTRYFFRDMVQRKFSSRLQSVQDAMQREGAFYLFSLRLMPAIPFFVINALMGLTRIRVATFWWISQIGMLPATVAYVYAGSQFPSLQKMASEGVGNVLSWQLLLAFAIIGILPLILKWMLTRYRTFSSESRTAKINREDR